MTNALTDISSAALKRAAGIKERIEALQKELAVLLGVNGTLARPKTGRKKRTVSAATKARIAEAQRRRWAKQKGRGNASVPSVKSKNSKNRIRAATRAKLAAIAKARWAKVKAAGRKAL